MTKCSSQLIRVRWVAYHRLGESLVDCRMVICRLRDYRMIGGLSINRRICEVSPFKSVLLIACDPAIGHGNQRWIVTTVDCPVQPALF